MTHTVFYSWQSDLPNNTNRSLIEQALESAATAIRADDTVSVEPVIDRDTAGVGGSPQIANTIFGKIARSAVFVAEISIINSGTSERPTPNPNVLIELGFAFHAIGAERVVMVMNSRYGGPNVLPFDLKLRHVVTYTSEPDETSRGDSWHELTARLEVQLRTILATFKETATANDADALDEAIRSVRADRKSLARNYLDGFYQRLFALAPSTTPRTDDELVTSLDGTKSLVSEFGKISNTIAIAEDVVVAEVMFDSLNNVLARYDRPEESSATSDSEFDFYRFLGHEIFVSLISAFLHERQLALLQRILARDVELPATHRTRTRPFHDLQRGTSLLWARSKRLNLMSAHGALLRERHEEGDLGVTVPFDHFLGADYFLFLYAEAKNHDGRVRWFPPTAPYFPKTSTFLSRLQRSDFAIQVAGTLGLSGIEELRKLIVDSEVKLARPFGIDWSRMPEAFNPSLIGSR